MASRLIRDAVEAGVILAHDPEAPPRHMKHEPFWSRAETLETLRRYLTDGVGSWPDRRVIH